MNTTNPAAANTNITLVIGGTGKTGRRVVERLAARGLPVRVGSRSATPAFDWDDASTWEAALAGVSSIYLAYAPELAVPRAAAHVRDFARLAVAKGAKRIVLLSGRGDELVLPAEEAVRASGADLTILRAAFFAQNFSEGFLGPQEGAIVFPAGDVAEPFIDVDDIADVAVLALTDPSHAGKTYDLSGPRLLTLAEIAGEIGRRTGQAITYVPVSFDEYEAILRPFMPAADAAALVGVFRTVLDGRNAHVSLDVERLLGRKATDFDSFAQRAFGA